jgi:hypothetical protein
MSLCKICQPALPDLPSSGEIPATSENSTYVTKGPLAGTRTWKKQMDPNQPSVISWTSRGESPMHLSWETFITSLDADCPVCWKVWRTIRSSPIASPRDEQVEEFRASLIGITYKPDGGEFTIGIWVTGTGLKQTQFRFHIWKATKEIFERV